MQMHLKKKLIFSFLIAASFTLIVSVLGIFGMTDALSRIQDIGENNLPSTNSLWKINQAQSEARSAARAMMYPDASIEEMNRLKKEYFVSIEDMNSGMKEYEPLATTDTEKELLKILLKQLDEWNRMMTSQHSFWEKKEAMIRDGIREKNPESYEDHLKNMRSSLRTTAQIFDESTVTLLKLTEFNIKLASDAAINAQKSVGFLRMILLFLAIAAITCSIMIGMSIANSTLRLLGADPSEISDVVKTISTGDTSVQLNNHSKTGVYADIRTMVKGLNDKTIQAEAIAAGDLTKEIVLLSDRDSLGKSFQTMTGVLRDVISRSNLAANQVSAGSDQVSSASQSLSQGATEQAAAVEEISSSVTEISTKIRANAEAATTASETAQKAQLAAEQGNGQIDVTLRAMNDINNSSQEISKIIKVIDDIAFQTNLLALNAAVEAARAGRHGKGFAVVADEVRNLAGRSAKAARETTDLIESSSRKVDGGLQEAKKTAESFKEIVNGSLRVASIVKQIAEASKEQAAAIAQIASGINQINNVTQTTTASAEETASAAEELAGQSQELKRSLAYFRIGDDRGNDRPGNFNSPARVISIRPPSSASGEQSDWGRSAQNQQKNFKSEKHDSNLTLDDNDFGKYRA